MPVIFWDSHDSYGFVSRIRPLAERYPPKSAHKQSISAAAAEHSQKNDTNKQADEGMTKQKSIHEERYGCMYPLYDPFKESLYTIRIDSFDELHHSKSASYYRNLTPMLRISYRIIIVLY